MFPYQSQDEQGLHPLSDDDQQVLLGLVRRYGVSSLACALGGVGTPSRASTFSATTLLSNTSAPSLTWSSSEASHARSDAASIRTQSTWQDGNTDIPSIHDGETGKITDRTWLDSPSLIQSPVPSCDVTSQASPRHVVPTSKKYQCPMCFLDNNPVGFGRKSDFKKHLYNFHGTDVIWICKTKGCHLSFATERAYSTHAKEMHRMDALPNSSAKTDLCPQVVFSCGFENCKDRIFEAQNSDQASASRDKYFEHIAKHFEDGFDVNNWEYKVQIHHLMRQDKVKSIWKTCIWPKEKRQALTWKPRSSGDLKRMLEARHLGEDISTLVRLAYILGTAPFTNGSTPPPSEIDLQFSLPIRSQCLMDAVGHVDGARPKSDNSSPAAPVKQQPQTPPPSALPARRIKQETRPTTPVDGLPEPMIRDDLTAGPHPGTPFPIPNENIWPVDAPKFAPDQMNTFADASMTYILPGQELPQQTWDMTGVQHFQQPPDEIMTNVYMSPNPSQATVRPATPIPSKRPGSWGKRLSLENLRPKKKAASIYGSPASDTEAVPPVPSMYAANVIPTSMPAGYELPMRMGHPQQSFTSHPVEYMQQSHQMQQQLCSPTTFFIDDSDMRQ